MNGPADDAELRRQLLLDAWTDTCQRWTDEGASHFELHHLSRITEQASVFCEALRRLQEALHAAEQATEH